MNPSYEVLSGIAGALGVTVDYLLTYPNEEDDAEIQELTGLFQACPKQMRKLILAVMRTVTRELNENDVEKL